MAAGDLDYGVQDVEEEFAIVPGTGGRTIYVTASFSLGWKGKPLKRIKSIYRYEFNAVGKIVDWDARYDPIFVYDLLGGRDGTSACLTREATASQGSLPVGFAAGVLSGVIACLTVLRVVERRGSAARPPAQPMI